MTTDLQESRRNHLALDTLWKGATTFDYALLRSCLSDDFLYWMNVDLGGDLSEASRAGVGADSIVQLLEWEKTLGMRVSISDERRLETADGMVQQDIATVVREGQAMRFARCHLFQMANGKIRRWWEYYDGKATDRWGPEPVEIRVTGR